MTLQTLELALVNPKILGHQKFKWNSCYDWIGSRLEVIKMTLRLRFLMFSIKGNRVHAEFHFCTLWYLLPHKILHNFIEIYWPKDSWWLRRTVPNHMSLAWNSRTWNFLWCSIFRIGVHRGLWQKLPSLFVSKVRFCATANILSMSRPELYATTAIFLQFFIFFALFLRISLLYFSFNFSLN